eukprot:TRINITY_DN38556_c0_g2_i1.p2 TRINITY_DN38556_c0_g2~~TRINITY_DN38556_c0_g2_i1.p2  ORF type:complete len:126 (-),score=10.14 TRINITY_DN38556_c0_g2_i1:4-381(-)
MHDVLFEEIKLSAVVFLVMKEMFLKVVQKKSIKVRFQKFLNYRVLILQAEIMLKFLLYFYLLVLSSPGSVPIWQMLNFRQIGNIVMDLKYHLDQCKDKIHHNSMSSVDLSEGLVQSLMSINKKMI